MKRPKLVPRVYRPRASDRIAKSEHQPERIGPWTPSAPGVPARPILHPRTGQALTWAEHREQQVMRKSGGKSAALIVGQVIHFEHQGQIVHGKVKAWGDGGARVVSTQGEHEVPYRDLKVGRHPNAGFDHEDQPIRPTIFTADDLRVGMFVTSSSFEGLAQVIGLHDQLVEVALPGERRFLTTYSTIQSATWERP